MRDDRLTRCRPRYVPETDGAHLTARAARRSMRRLVFQRCSTMQSLSSRLDPATATSGSPARIEIAPVFVRRELPRWSRIETEALLLRCSPDYRVLCVLLRSSASTVAFGMSRVAIGVPVPRPGAGKKHERADRTRAVAEASYVDRCAWLSCAAVSARTAAYSQPNGPYEYLSLRLLQPLRTILELFVDVCVTWGSAVARPETGLRLNRREDVEPLARTRRSQV